MVKHGFEKYIGKTFEKNGITRTIKQFHPNSDKISKGFRQNTLETIDEKGNIHYMLTVNFKRWLNKATEIKQL